MIDAIQLRNYVVRPVLMHLATEIPYSRAAEHLLLGTAAQESHGEYLHQLGKGPAVGLWQMEPFTHDDLWKTILSANKALAVKVDALELPGFLGNNDAREMAGNMYYACAMCRVFYRRIRAPLPNAGNVADMAYYWKRYYNTLHGKGTEAEFVRNWKRISAAIE